MITEILNRAHRLDGWLRTRIGRPYHVLLGIGLIVEIVKELRERWEHGAAEGGLVRTALSLLLFAALLIDQLSALGEHFERREGRKP